VVYSVVSVLKINAALEGGADTSVNGFTKNITNGLFDLSVDSSVKILIWVDKGLFVSVFTTVLLSIEFIVNLTSSPSLYGLAVAFIIVPVHVGGTVVN
jgi:hypothetical protein